MGAGSRGWRAHGTAVQALGRGGMTDPGQRLGGEGRGERQGRRAAAAAAAGAALGDRSGARALRAAQTRPAGAEAARTGPERGPAGAPTPRHPKARAARRAGKGGGVGGEGVSPSSRSSTPRSAALREPPGSGAELKMASMRNRLGTRSATSSPARSRGPSRSHGSCGGPGTAIPRAEAGSPPLPPLKERRGRARRG